MSFYTQKKLSVIIALVIIVAFTSSCVNTQKAIYFNNIRDTTLKAIGTDMQPLIQINDLLSISITSLNPEATIIFNTPNIPAISVSAINGQSTQTSGYLVNQDGNIQFPVLGYISATGLTKKQLSDKIAKELVTKKLLLDPIVNIRFLNFKVTVLGEVARPTVVSVSNEKITVLEALGFAGDLTIYAKRDNVLLIREENGNRILRRINLNSSDILRSPYYYLKSNDVIYAEPNKVRIASAGRSSQIIPIIISSLSLLAIIIDRATR
jgi:polysaccharide export outer membrane protein